jgi:hypothetical protein
MRPPFRGRIRPLGVAGTPSRFPPETLYVSDPAPQRSTICTLTLVGFMFRA